MPEMRRLHRDKSATRAVYFHAGNSSGASLDTGASHPFMLRRALPAGPSPGTGLETERVPVGRLSTYGGGCAPSWPLWPRFERLRSLRPSPPQDPGQDVALRRREIGLLERQGPALPSPGDDDVVLEAVGSPSGRTGRTGRWVDVELLEQRQKLPRFVGGQRIDVLSTAQIDACEAA